MVEAVFRALVVREGADGAFVRAVEERAVGDLPAGEVLVRVRYSSLNYKDALSASGHKGVTKRYPHTPGVDAAGVVEASDDPNIRIGDEVIVTGYDLGMNTAGGFGQYIRVPGAWVVARPAGLTLAEAMAIGTAGFTAALGLVRLQQFGVVPDSGDVFVTGASGGVGSMAVGILARAGYRVVASTGKREAHELLRELGAAAIVGREDVVPGANRGLATPRWAGAIETVGGATLDHVLRQVQPRGAVACCGMIGGAELRTSVFPLILRGAALVGLDAAETPMGQRREIWSRLAGDWKPRLAQGLVTECGLDDLSGKIDAMLAGRSLGRVRVGL